ncbi:hypothetical protein SDC9_210039 [bioreactor metagenome]|uniref:Uncharacterized protein n=1 Tax=bioreactor metagenome TaxID=1076179 RepID=A0A645JGF4_9ZZZZ
MAAGNRKPPQSGAVDQGIAEGPPQNRQRFGEIGRTAVFGLAPVERGADIGLIEPHFVMQFHRRRRAHAGADAAQFALVIADRPGQKVDRRIVQYFAGRHVA